MLGGTELLALLTFPPTFKSISLVMRGTNMINKKRLIILSLVLAFVIFCGCQQNNSLDFYKQEEQNYSEAIKVVDKYFSNVVKGNYDAAFNLLDIESLSPYEDGTRMDLEKFTKEWKESEITKFEIINEGVIKYEDKYVVQTIVYHDSGEIIILPFIVQKQANSFLIQEDISDEEAPPYVQPRVLVPDKNHMKY